MGDYRLSDKEIIQLKRRHRKAKTKRDADRLKAVYLLGEGWDPHTVAHVLDKDDRTILSYFQHYKAGGSDQLLQNNHSGKEAKLTAEQEQELSDHLRNHIYTSSIDIIHFLRVTFHVTFSRTGIKHLLKRLNFTYHKPKLVPGKADFGRIRMRHVPDASAENLLPFVCEMIAPGTFPLLKV